MKFSDKYKPDTPWGYTEKKLAEVIGRGYLLGTFIKWMDGQTVMVTEAGETVYYTWDVDRFFENQGRRDGPEAWD